MAFLFVERVDVSGMVGERIMVNCECLILNDKNKKNN